MKIARVNLLYFSATGVTQKCLQNIAQGIGMAVNNYDLTPHHARKQKYEFKSDDLVLIGMPVYRGRIPSIAAEFFSGVTAQDTPAVFVVSYGNREYDNALLELKDCCEEKGFVGIAAAAFIGEHSSSKLIATGRPDAQDQAKLAAFGQQVKEKLCKLTDRSELQKLQVKGVRPYGPDVANNAAPATNENCDNCGICAANCPTLAINPDNVRDVKVEQCISCRRCIHLCPQEAKYVADSHSINFMAALIKKASERKEPEIFI